jgi:ABC-type multidrug transport system fused ATPase/permease subunit
MKLILNKKLNLLQKLESKIMEVKIKQQKEFNNPKDSKLISLCFGLFGIASLLAWNAVIAQIPFFSHYLDSLNPSVSFPLLNKLFNIPLQFILLIKKRIFPLKSQLIFSIIVSIICLLCLPFFIFPFEKNSLISIIITILLVLVMGLINALIQSGFLALTSYFPLDKIVFYSTGQGISGIIMALLVLVVLFYINTGDVDDDFKYGSLIFFGISIFILLIVFCALIYIFNSDYGKEYLPSSAYSNNNFNIDIDDNQAIKASNVDREKTKIIQKNNDEINKKKYWFFELFKSLKDCIFFIWYNFFITFSVYPSVYIGQQLFDTGKYKTNIIILIFCFCNTLGRYIMKFCKPSKGLGYKIILGRTILVFLLIFNHYCNIILEINSNVTSCFLILNLILLSGSNGFDSSLCFGLAPTLVTGEYKGKAGNAISLFQVFGGVCGSSCAFITQKIIKTISAHKIIE